MDVFINERQCYVDQCFTFNLPSDKKEKKLSIENFISKDFLTSKTRVTSSLTTVNAVLNIQDGSL